MTTIYDEDWEDQLASRINRAVRLMSELDEDPETAVVRVKRKASRKRRPAVKVGRDKRGKRHRPKKGMREEPPMGAFHSRSYVVLKAVEQMRGCSYQALLRETGLEDNALGCSIGELIQAKLIYVRGEGEARRYYAQPDVRTR